MDDKDNPYDILGVSKDASSSQIRSAYRKLALKHHPDKQDSEEAKQRATERFAKISNAYEILSDADRRHDLDRPRQHDDFFYNAHRFHDPFQVFAQVFGEEFGSAPRAGSRRHAFEDDFFRDPFMGGGMMSGDPFFGGGSMFGGGSFFGGGSMFGRMQQQMDSMRQQQEEMARRASEGGWSNERQSSNGNGGSQSYSYYSSSSSNFGGGGGGESISTTTRMINGKRQTVTERTVRKPDGTVERHVETTGDEDFPQIQQQDPFYRNLEQNQNNFNHRQLQEHAAEEEGDEAAPKTRRFFSKRKSKRDDGPNDPKPRSRY